MLSRTGTLAQEWDENASRLLTAIIFRDEVEVSSWDSWLLTSTLYRLPSTCYNQNYILLNVPWGLAWTLVRYSEVFRQMTVFASF